MSGRTLPASSGPRQAAREPAQPATARSSIPAVMDRGRWVRNWIPVAVGVLLAVPLGLAQTSGGSENPLSPCLEQLASSHADAPAADPDQASGACALRSSPETFADLADASHAVAQRVAADSTSDYAAAARERARLAES